MRYSDTADDVSKEIHRSGAGITNLFSERTTGIDTAVHTTQSQAHGPLRFVKLLTVVSSNTSNILSVVSELKAIVYRIHLDFKKFLEEILEELSNF